MNREEKLKAVLDRLHAARNSDPEFYFLHALLEDAIDTPAESKG